MANNIAFECMIIEAGIIANCVSANAAGALLAGRISTEAAAAWADELPSVTIDISPFEAGMVLDGLSRSQDRITGDIGDRILRAVNKLMNDLNIQPLPGEPGGTTPGESGDVPADGPVSETPAEPEAELTGESNVEGDELAETPVTESADDKINA